MKQKLRYIFGLGLVLLSLNIFAAAQKSVVPILEMGAGGLLGGIQNGKFLDAKTTFAMLKGEESYDLFGILGKNGKLTVTIQKSEEPCEDFYSFKNETEIEQGIAIGAGLSWNPVPRLAKTIGLTDKTYLKIVSDILRSKGFPKAKAKIEQAVRVDLDGDGVEEVLITASSYGGKISPSANVNDYSFVVVRKVVGGKVQNIMLAQEYVKKKIEFGAPSRFELSAIADLNGDGKMEIVIYYEYYEGSSAGVYEIKGGKAVDVKQLETGCGV